MPIEKEIKLYPLTHPQKRIWYLEQLNPGTSGSVIGGFYRIHGLVDFTALDRAINHIIKRNDGLRIRFFLANDEPHQAIMEYRYEKIDFYDFSRAEHPQDQFAAWIQKKMETPFELIDSSLYYFVIVKLSETECGYAGIFHHIIIDGWSIALMADQIKQHYEAFRRTGELQESEEYSYLNYLALENEYFTSNRFFKNREYWHKKFSPLPEPALKSSTGNFHGKRRIVNLDEELSARFNEFAGNMNTFLNNLCIALFVIYLHKARQLDDIILGIPVFNRFGPREKMMVGMATSTVALRISVKQEMSFAEFITEVNREIKTAYINQRYPYDLLVHDLELRKNGYETLFDISVNYYNTRNAGSFAGQRALNEELYSGQQFYSMQLVVKEWGENGQLTLMIDYKITDYLEIEIDQFIQSFLELFAQVSRNVRLPIAEIQLLAKKDRDLLLYRFNQTERISFPQTTITGLFEEQAANNPAGVALSFKNRRMTYEELNRKSSQLANYLLDNNLAASRIIGLCMKHSFETVIAILAVLKCGSAYVPIDPDYPAGRIRYIIENARVHTILTNFDWKSGLDARYTVLNLVNCVNAVSSCKDTFQSVTENSDLHYVIYTSGSTGLPKGVMVTGGNLVNYIAWAKAQYAVNSADVFPLYSSIAFDLTVTSIFTPLISGAEICIYPADDDGHVLMNVIAENRSTIIKLTPAHLLLLKELPLPENCSVKRFIVGGEDLKVNLAGDIHEKLHGRIEIFNEYGPTEATVGCMIHRYSFEKDCLISVPIGRPIMNTRIYILDRQLSPLPVGAIGEIYISGKGVALGYMGNETLTGERFLDDPFFPDCKMYKTGDLARFIDCYTIEYCGRIDKQVKIRGYRIETGEIEAALAEHPAAERVIVIAREDEGSDKYLCAYLTGDEGRTDSGEMRRYLLSRLPEYMVPRFFVFLDELPVTPNGKVNRGALPSPVVNPGGNRHITGHHSLTGETGRLLIRTLQTVLNRESICPEDNFFELGGDSIKAIQVSNRLLESRYRLRPKDMLANPLVNDMAAFMIEEKKTQQGNRELCTGRIANTPVIQWFFSRNLSRPEYFNQAVLLELKTPVDLDALQKFLSLLVSHHDILRLNYDKDRETLYYNNSHLEKAIRIAVHDLKADPYEKQLLKIEESGRFLKAGFDLENSLLFNACLFEVQEDKQYLLLNAHHLVIDGVSWRILLDDLDTLITQWQKREELKLPQKTSSYQEWALALREFSKNELEIEKKYWQGILAQNNAAIYDCPRLTDCSGKIGTIQKVLSPELTICLQESANIPYGTRNDELVLIALVDSLFRMFCCDSLLLELEGHGREDIFPGIDTNRTVGWFTCMYPALFRKNYDDDIVQRMKSLKEQIRNIPSNGLTYGVLKYLKKEIPGTVDRLIRYNYLGDVDAGFTDKHFVMAVDIDSGCNSALENTESSILVINSMIVKGKLVVFFDYREQYFHENTVLQLADDFIHELEKVLNHCSGTKEKVFVPSDFNMADLSQDDLDALLV